MSSTYRKKPVEIEARRVDLADPAAVTEIVEWCGGEAVGSWFRPHVISITTLEGTMFADDGDWIIKGVQGEFYPCKPGIFEETYEAVTETAAG